MAEKPNAEEADAQPKKKSKLPLIIAAVVLLAGGGGAAWWFLKPKHDETKTAEETKEPIGPAHYLALEPPFVVNFQSKEVVRFLQVAVQLMSHDLETIELVKANDPAIRNDLLLLFSGQSATELADRNGKESLRGAALEAVKEVVKQAGGEPEKVEALYFTSFVMQ
ncbi:MAG: flagellar basal body-associated FliL family protein [Steroidobacteraceae bacterium]